MRQGYRFDEVYVVSDLHLGGAAPARQTFRQGKLLADLIDHLAARPAKRSIALVINGDAVDFLAEPEARAFDPEGAVSKLEAIFGYPEFSPVWQALGRFVAKVRRTLVFVLGNHDLELALPWVRRRLVEEIAGGDDRCRGRIELALDGTGFRCQVGGAQVLCLHGNEVDPFNVTDYDQLRRLGRDLQFGREVEPWIPNAGTQLVIDVINEVKHQHAFVDLLKPEAKAVIPILLALRPETVERAGSVLEAAARAARDWTRSKLRLLGDDAASSATPRERPPGRAQLVAELTRQTFRASGRRAAVAEVDQLFKEVEKDLADGAEPIDFVTHDEAGERLGAGRALFDFVRGGKPRQVVREALQSLHRDRSFDARGYDQTYRDLDLLVAPEIDFLVAGHTHLERTLRRAHGPGYYLNSGTWVRLIELLPDMLVSDENFRPIWKALEAGSVRSLDACIQPRLVRDKPAVVSIIENGGGVRGTLNRVRWGASGIVLAPRGEVFERS